MNETQRMMYQSLVSIRNNEVNLRWTRNQLFFLVNSAAISLVAVQMQVTSLFYGFACIGGIILCLLWICLIGLIQRTTDYWDSMLAALEGLNGQPIQIFKGEEWKKMVLKKPNANHILTLLAGIFFAVWLIMLNYWGYRYFFMGR